MSTERKIKVGSRRSELALVQTNHVISLLERYHPDKKFEVVTMNTMGDKILDIALPKIGSKSLFTRELEAALTSGNVDFVVHSLKDLPTSLPDEMAIGAVLAREDPRDALVLHKDMENHTLSTLPANSIIGTSSLRRTAQLAKKYPNLIVENIRGNLNTRLKKLDDLGKYQAIVLAAAGLIRIGWKSRISEILEADDFLYAVGQGALAVECRSDNHEIIKLLEPLYNAQTTLSVIAERSFLKTLGGGCSAPVGVTSNLSMHDKNLQISMTGAVWSLDGKDEIKESDKIILTNPNGLIKSDLLTSLNNESHEIDSSDEPAKKKMKIDVSENVLKADPHKSCPVEMPIGYEFMGKCPYLEGDYKDVVVTEPVVETKQDGNKCPFLKKYDLKISEGVNSQTSTLSENNSHDNLFVGLVPHKTIGNINMEKARVLGENLAKKLIDRGALDIMSKAQSIIHGQQTEVVQS